MEISTSVGRKENQRPFSGLSDNAAHWQGIYASAVVIAQIMQRNGLDPDEAKYLLKHEIHLLFMSAKIYTFEEQIIFDVAVHLLRERHDWSYGN